MAEFENVGLTAPRVLLVEDIRVDRVVLSAMLRRFNCDTTIALNGKEAVDLFYEGETFDLVLLDKDMPVMTGPEAVAKIRAMGATDVLIFGVSADLGGPEAFMRAGADGFITKPMALGVLEAIVEEIISKKSG
ncbi:hypothetical protein ACP4OV_015366 [Aristida adscensionis]